MERGIDEGIYRKDIEYRGAFKIEVENVWIHFNPEYYTSLKYPFQKFKKKYSFIFVWNSFRKRIQYFK